MWPRSGPGTSKELEEDNGPIARIDEGTQEPSRAGSLQKAPCKGCAGPRDQASSPVPHHPLAKVRTLHIPDSSLEDKYLAQTESGPAAS